MRPNPRALLLCSAFFLACGSSDPNDLNGTANPGSGASSTGAGSTIIVPTGGNGANTGSGGANSGPWMLPAGFSKATKGGWQLGEELTGDPAPIRGLETLSEGSTSKNLP